MNLAELGKRIKSQRTRRQLTQSQLANSLYISAQAVSKWERGENAPDISLLPKLSMLLERSIEWIITGDDREHSTFPATVLATSMRNFISKTSEMAPESIALWMNGIFHTMTEAALIHDGVPVKYTGDGFLAYFAGNNYAARAVQSAKKIAETVKEKGLLLTLHSGEIYLGAIGHQDYATPDIIGKTVNSTFILNRWATEHSSANIIVSEDTKVLCKEKLEGKSIATGLKETAKVFEI